MSTIASKSAFSTSGRVVSPHRNRSHSKILEALMCLQNWFLVKRKGNISVNFFLILIYDACLLHINLFVGANTLGKNGFATIHDDLDVEDMSLGIFKHLYLFFLK